MKLYATAMVAACAAALLVSGMAAPAKPSGLSKARQATAKYHRFAAAKADGYKLLRDAKGIACIESPSDGAMGIHYVKGDLVGDGAIDLRTPEAVMYERQRGGRKRLIAVEYVVFQEAWDAKHSSPPRLFGKRFELVPAGNRYGLPPFYELHVWLWKKNPSGTFADYNPRVSC